MVSQYSVLSTQHSLYCYCRKFCSKVSLFTSYATHLDMEAILSFKKIDKDNYSFTLIFIHVHKNGQGWSSLLKYCAIFILVLWKYDIFLPFLQHQDTAITTFPLLRLHFMGCNIFNLCRITWHAEAFPNLTT